MTDRKDRPKGAPKPSRGESSSGSPKRERPQVNKQMEVSRTLPPPERGDKDGKKR